MARKSMKPTTPGFLEISGGFKDKRRRSSTYVDEYIKFCSLKTQEEKDAYLAELDGTNPMIARAIREERLRTPTGIGDGQVRNSPRLKEGYAGKSAAKDRYSASGYFSRAKAGMHSVVSSLRDVLGQTSCFESPSSVLGFTWF